MRLPRRHELGDHSVDDVRRREEVDEHPRQDVADEPRFEGARAAHAVEQDGDLRRIFGLTLVTSSIGIAAKLDRQTCSIARIRRSGSSMPPDGVSMEISASPPLVLLYMHARKSCTAGITRDGFNSVSRSVDSLFTLKDISL